MADPDFKCDCAMPGESFPHFWEHTIGSGHATLALRADYQTQLKRCRDEIGIRYVRFHGILCDDMGTFLIYDDKPLYSFFNADQIFDFLLSIGMKPFVELSFMPYGLSSSEKTQFHYRANVTPPRDYDLWATLIEKLAAHWVERYGIDEVSQWFFEVWNEPNLDAFGSGDQGEYFKLYDYTAQAIKRAHPELKVGGPATAANAWITDFLQHCAKNNIPADFVSTHHYPTDAFGNPGDDTETQLADSRRSVLREQTMQAKKEAGDKPLYYTEWSTSSNPRDPLHDRPYAAAFIVKTIMENTGLVNAYSYWTFSDIFEENYFPSVPFHGGFGLLNIHGIAKPAYRAYQLLHDLGNSLLPVGGQHDTVDAWVVAGDTGLTVLVTNFALPRHPVKNEMVHVRLNNVKCAPSRITIRRIDDDNANARRAWIDDGEPEYLSAAEVARLDKASQMSVEEIDFTYHDGQLDIVIPLPPLGIASIRIESGNPV